MTILAILLAAAASAQPQMSAPLAPAGVTELHDRFIESTDPIKKAQLLAELARTPPANTGDVQSLFDIFMRFDDATAREAALGSLQLVSFQNPELNDLLLNYLQQPEPEAKVFAIKGAARVRDDKALPLIEKLAKQKFPFKKVEDAVLVSEKNEWWVHFAAVEALAQWRGEDYLPALVKLSDKVPEIARLMGLYMWEKSLPYFEKWAASPSKTDQERARAGLSAPTPTAALRASRERLLLLLREPARPKELRHEVALKIGLTSTPEETAALLKEYEGVKDGESRLLYKAALFAAHDKQVAPLLIETARSDSNPLNRAGALAELKDILPAPEMLPLWQWTAANDPDAGNRETADRELRALRQEQKPPQPAAQPAPSPRKKSRKG